MTRTPLFIQSQQTECCIAVLGAMLGYFGRSVTLAELREVTGISRDCLSAADMARAARHYGLAARVLRKEPGELAALGLPLIVHLDFIHFAVLEEISATEVLLNDPSHGPERLPREVFDERFTGIAIALAPTPQFERNAPPPRLLAACAGRLPPQARRPLAAAALVALLMPLVPLALAWTAFAGSGAQVVAGAALVAAALRMLLAWLQAGTRERAERAIREDGERRFVESMARQPQSFFDYRIPSALQAIAGLPQALAGAVCRQLLPAWARLAETVILLAGLAWLAPAFGAAVCAVLGAAAVLAWAAGGRGRWRLNRLLAPAPETASYSANGIESTRTGGQAEEALAARAGALAADVGQLQWLASWALRIRLVQHGCLLVLVALLARYAAGAPAGQVLALLLLAAPLPLALPWLARLPACLHNLRVIAQLQDDAQAPPAGPPQAGSVALSPAPALVARHLVFGYARNRAPVLDDVSLDVAPGEIVGLTGASGAGKSTLAALLCGLAQPWSGELRFGGVAPGALDPGQRAGAIAWVDKFPPFFAGSVRANLTLWQDGVGEATLRQALDDACLGELVASRPGALDSGVAPRAANFSGGQRQRLALARALVGEPRLLILDEATDGLDSALEAALLSNLRRRGCSVVLISHRSATLAACDRVLRLKNGTLAQDAASAPSRSASAAGFHDAPDEADEPAPPLPEPGQLRDCLRQLAERCGLPWDTVAQPAAPAATRAQAVLALARAQGWRLRPVRMVARSWWREDPGPLLVFERASGRPALLVAGPGRGYIMFDATGARRPVTAPEHAFDDDAYAPMPRADKAVPASVAALLARVGWHGRQDWGGTLAACVLDAVLGVAALCSAALLAWPAAAAALVASLLLRWQAGVRLARVLGRDHAALDATLRQTLHSVPPAAFGRYTALRLTSGADAAPAMLRALQDDRRGVPPVAAAACSLLATGAGLAWLWPALWPAWAALALAAMLPLAWAAGPARLRVRRARVLRRRAQFLQHVLHHVGSLRAAGRADAALRRWLGMPWRQPVGLARRLRAASAWRSGYPLAALGLLLAWVLTAPAAAPAGARWLATAALALSMLVHAGRLCQAAMAWATALDERRALHRLLRAPREPAPSADTAQGPARVQAHALCFTYPGSPRPALDSVSIELAPGRITALAGASGSGKSTLLRLLLGFETASHGQVLVDGVAPGVAGMAALRESTGLVMQDEVLNGAGPLRWQLAGMGTWPLGAVWQALGQAVLARDVRRMPMGVLTIVDSARLATGQLQRLLIARCLLRRPRLLVLDEATSALPDEMQAELLGRIRALGVTCLLVSHRDSALACADEVLVLAHGKVAARGAPGSPPVRAALGTLAGQEGQAWFEPAPEAPAVAPASGVPAMRRGLFRDQALRRFQGEGSNTSPLLLLRRARWPGWLAAALLAALAARLA
ncbi:ATP-binding cassette domain-containing protein [Massilia solisilvae]|uniref:ATP-binding cassette domain-containing protein n=1 Tax=Massilia solisilvae TaxID=1811225 RepID=A0ABT2BN81_9BURK|nr:ATP-binding cassette domain-containing protein [Massilia solisilvae]MCS0609949.1 ATP-binding cassette domain-containing protein [Massilia solisilvae]